MPGELGESQLSSLLETVPGLASVLRSPVADAIVKMIRAGAGLGEFDIQDARELVQYATRRGLIPHAEGATLMEEVEALVPSKRKKKAKTARAGSPRPAKARPAKAAKPAKKSQKPPRAGAKKTAKVTKKAPKKAAKKTVKKAATKAAKKASKQKTAKGKRR